MSPVSQLSAATVTRVSAVISVSLATPGVPNTSCRRQCRNVKDRLLIISSCDKNKMSVNYVPCTIRCYQWLVKDKTWHSDLVLLWTLFYCDHGHFLYATRSDRTPDLAQYKQTCAFHLCPRHPVSKPRYIK